MQKDSQSCLRVNTTTYFYLSWITPSQSKQKLTLTAKKAESQLLVGRVWEINNKAGQYKHLKLFFPSQKNIQKMRGMRLLQWLQIL